MDEEFVPIVSGPKPVLEAREERRVWHSSPGQRSRQVCRPDFLLDQRMAEPSGREALDVHRSRAAREA